MGLPTQVTPPVVELSDLDPWSVEGAAVVAIPVLADEHGPTLGPGAAAVVAGLGEDLFELLELAEATGAVGEVVDRT
ncbi:MAG: leucyl aminopeptidase, partial [Nocardioidaceae bacterium]